MRLQGIPTDGCGIPAVFRRDWGESARPGIPNDGNSCYFCDPFGPSVGRQERQRTATMPAGLKPADFDAMTVGAESGETGKFNECGGLARGTLGHWWRVRISGNVVVDPHVQ